MPVFFGLVGAHCRVTRLCLASFASPTPVFVLTVSTTGGWHGLIAHPCYIISFNHSYLVVIRKSTWRAIQSEFRAPGLMLVDF
ncbi:hypothetical protein GOBAR_AA27062 [Gossypium barbadense]|uniref:Uncharacterized protein n=1 Tax=Gossypium barbadense TaxID=3634 RepID=A0A2P5WR92_GOSBA|nr:hypothetical protein GOBAR_AA27062 [Gossypium barbadense]